MREVELKAVVEDVATARRQVEKAGARLVFEGKTLRRRYTRIRESPSGTRSARRRTRRPVVEDVPGLEGPTETQGVDRPRRDRDRGDAPTPARNSDSARLVGVMEIDRQASVRVGGAMIRFETDRAWISSRVEGEPESIEQERKAGYARTFSRTADKFSSVRARTE